MDIVSVSEESLCFVNFEVISEAKKVMGG